MWKDEFIYEETLISLDGIDIVNGLPMEFSQWVSQNIQKFSKLMGISMKCMEAQTFLSFSKIENRRRKKKE